MDFSNQHQKLSLLGDKKLTILVYLALYGDNIRTYSTEMSSAYVSLRTSEREFNKITQELAQEGYLQNFFYNISIMSSQVIPILTYAFSKRPDIVTKVKPLFKKRSDALKFYELIGYAFCGGNLPSERIALSDHAKDFIAYLPHDDPQVFRLASFMSEDYLNVKLVSTINLYHIIGKCVPQSLFDMWKAESEGRQKNLVRLIDALQSYNAYVQEGIYDPDIDNAPLEHPIRLYTKAIRACNMGEYEQCIELVKLAADSISLPMGVQDVPPLFFVAYFLLAACVHLSTPKSKSLAKKLISNSASDYLPYTIASLLAEIKLDPRNQANPLSVRRKIATSYNGVSARNAVYLAQMIGRHFEVPALPFVTGESDYAIVRHEVTPISQQPAELIAAYGSIPSVLSIPYKQKWERLLDSISEELSGDRPTADTTTKQTRYIYVLNESTNEVYPMEQSWLKSQRWGKPRSITRVGYSISKIENPDKYDEAFASLCTSSYYWPQASVVLPALKGCNRLYVNSSRRGIDLEELKITEEVPYISITPKSTGFAVSSNILASDLDRQTVIKKKKDGSYAYYPISRKAKAVLQPLLTEVTTFPKEAEEKLRSILATVDDVIEVRSELLDRKSLPVYPGRPMVVAKLQPAPQGMYEAVFCAQPLPDSTKTPPPGQGRQELIETIAGQQVRVDRDIEGEKNAYSALCDALETVNGADVYEEDYRATLSIEAVLEMMSWAQAHSDMMAIDWLQGRGMQLKQTAGCSWNVGLKSNSGWFDIEGEVRIDDDTVLTMAQILDLVQQDRGKYLRVDDNLFIAIDKKLRRQLERIEALSIKNRNKLQISQFNAALLDDQALDGEFKIQFDQKLIELQKRIKECENYTPEVPPALKAELRPYQVEGFQWMSRLAAWGAGACLADDMGLGKTVQTIAFLLSKASEGPALVVAPASVVPNWMAEIERFAPALRATVLNRAEDRTATIKEAKDYDVILSTYGLLNTEEEALVEKKWSTICLDEAHTIKNRETKMSHSAMKLQADYRIILTGTPIQNHLGEIWNLFRFINPGLLGGFDTFRHKFVKPITEDNDKSRRKALQGILRPFMLRRTKDEVIDDLPEKNEITVPVELSDSELARYEAMRKKAAQEIEAADKVDINTLAEITRLRRAACSMELVDPTWKGESSKVQAFLDIVSEFKGNGRNRMLVFSQFTSYLDIVRKALDKAGEKYLYLDGSTTLKQREQLVAQFRNGNTPLFLISLKAGGLGLNLPEANYVMHLDPWWNPAIEQQATDRAYRIGQKRDVTVYHLVAKNTIEEKILRLHRTKRDMADSLLEGTDIAGKLTVKDILELISKS